MFIRYAPIAYKLYSVTKASSTTMAEWTTRTTGH